MHINPINNDKMTFQAKFYPYPNTLTNERYLKLFEERTKKYPKLILRQDNISYSGNDYFYLYDENKPSIQAHGFFSFTRNRPQNMEGFIKRLTEIFDTLLENPIPKMHEDII